MRPSRRYLVEGKVQGVGYRRFAQKQAESLGLAGWARNLADGRVEVWAQGAEDVLERFAEKLRAGPAFSVVEKVDIDARVADSFVGFEIRPDGERP